MRRLLAAIVVLTLALGPALVASAADTLGTKLDDAGITTKVKTKLTADKVKNLVKVHVETKDGVVHLAGTVPTEADKAEAERHQRDRLPLIARGPRCVGFGGAVFSGPRLGERDGGHADVLGWLENLRRKACHIEARIAPRARAYGNSDESA